MTCRECAVNYMEKHARYRWEVRDVTLEEIAVMKEALDLHRKRKKREEDSFFGEKRFA